MITKIKNFVFTKRFLKNFLLLIGVYILIVFVLNLYLNFYTNHGEKVEVPNLVGKNEKQIASLLESLDLNYEVSESVYDPSKPEGTIIEQDPAPTSQTTVSVKEDRTIRIKISKKTQLVEVPNCVNKSERFAENSLKSRGFKCRIEYTPSVESAGAVIQQKYNGKDIQEKQKIAIGSTITIVVGKNSLNEAIPIPDLMNLTICDVKSRLSSATGIQLVVICNNCVTSADSCSAIVNSQSPEYIEGGIIAPGTTITVHATK